MSRFTPNELAQHLKDGLLSFPVTPFTADLSLDEDALRQHVEWQSGYDVAGLFAAGGTGEGFSLSLEEHSRVVKIAVEASRPDVPVLGSAGGSTHMAIAQARGAEEAGAEGVLLLPPYLTECDQQGLLEHASAVIGSTKTAVIVYNRANAIYSADTVAELARRHENFIGFKDAIGDIEHLTRVYAKNGDRMFYLGGLPTAETFALPLLQLGMSTYSSAMFNFVPEFALEFYGDVRAQNRAAVNEKLNRFVLPYLEIRDRGKGFGVSIVKAGVEAIGHTAGPVRPPLHDLSETDRQDLARLIVEAQASPLLGAAATQS
ncbi:5-dehydro-4-deoxyglucarate dehydratase [Micrococcus sp. HG099]|uniref:5-dehydro-4-deoxyglucarate dehydratase n=1 Tax=Micrococcus sp. HG099 TaxID=2969755 RepID=UPI00215B3EC5|nr:5-dehydro-4-deoxyglucarate dehydratase [Micrococcus sp. HG099]MCR8674559.1 5-dehydro-4-deoxyglucarate dehydratase [Micrococcus sp. HG099]